MEYVHGQQEAQSGWRVLAQQLIVIGTHPMAPHDAERQISLRQAARAVYIDFEGFEEHSPSLLGVLVGNELEQIVLSEELRPAGNATNLRVGTIDEELRAILARCEREDRCVVAYSQHEKRMVRQYAGLDLSPRYRDARKIARRWKAKRHPHVQMDSYGLKDFLRFIGYQRGTYLGEQQTTQRIRAVADMLSRRGDFQRLTPVVKAKWTKVLTHNEIDCRGMQMLVVLAIGQCAFPDGNIESVDEAELEMRLSMLLP